jgi:hypothetical protein
VPPQWGVPIVDHHDHIFLWERHRVVSAQVFLKFPTSGEGPQGHEVLYHIAVFELMLNGVCVVWAGLLLESLEVVCQCARLALATAHARNAPHAKASCFLVAVIVVVSHGPNPLRDTFGHGPLGI